MRSAALHLVEVVLCPRVHRHIAEAQAEQLVPRVAEQLARVRVDREVPSLLVCDEDRHRAVLERFTD